MVGRPVADAGIVRDPRARRSLRWACVLVGAGLLVQGLTLLRTTPISFLLGLIGGWLLVLSGIGAFVRVLVLVQRAEDFAITKELTAAAPDPPESSR